MQIGERRGGGAKPIPASLKLIRGNPEHRPLKVEPQPRRDTLPEPPEFLSDLAKEEWHRIDVELYRLGLLTLVDVNPLAAYCQAYSRWVTAERALAKMAEKDMLTGGLMIKTTNGNAIQNPLVGTANKAAFDMVRYGAEFGLTPAGRARLAVSEQKTQGKFDGLLAG